MKTTELRWKELVDYCALFWANCENKLQIWRRGITLPATPTVYCLVNTKDVIVYVGQTSCLRRRIAQHVSSPRKERLEWDSVHIFSPQILSQHRRLQVEAFLILAAVPIGNQLLALRRTKERHWRQLRWRAERWTDYTQHKLITCPKCKHEFSP